MLWSRSFWKGAVDRALKTFAQVLLALILAGAGAGAVPSLGVHELDWVAMVSVSATATVISFLTSIASPDTVAAPYEAVPRRAVIEIHNDGDVS